VWNGFCGNLIRRSNRNLLLCALILLAGIAAIAYFNARYLTSFFAGAHTETVAQLAADDPAKLPNTFVRIPVDGASATGLQHITTDDTHPNGYVDSEYLATRVGQKIMLIRASGSNWADNVPAQTFEGRLRPVSADIQSKVSSVNPDLQFMPVYLDTVDYKSNGVVLLIFGIPLLLLALLFLWSYMQYSGDFARHPFARRLEKYGQLEMLVQEIDSETSGAQSTFTHRTGTVYLTPHWMLSKTIFGGTPMRLERVVWAYRFVRKRKLYFAITISKRHSIVAFDNLGQRFQTQLNEQKVGEILKELAARVPQAIYGYDKRVLKLWKSCGKDKSNFLPQALAIVSPQEPLKERSSSLPIS
jgi:hypothetical protein